MEFEEIASGYCFLEAPRVAGEHVWFTDLLLGGMHRLSPDGSIDVFLPDRTHIGGACLNEDGRVICGGPGGLVWLDPDTGRSGPVLDRIEGEVFHGTNDFFPDGKGGLYFGTLGSGGEYEQEQVPTAIFHIDADRRVTKQDDGLKFCNGIGLSPDGKRLYHVESLVGIYAYDVGPDGSLGHKALFSDRAEGDGLAVDAEGCVWVAMFDGGEIVRFRPDGSVERRIDVPCKVVTSLCFGGPDWRDLYVATGGNVGVDAMLRGELPPKEASLFHARSEVPGLPVPVTSFSLPPV
ncbi:MAG: SMP-30/gluconolactonase/LRE family protein [Novosphingobium sp.]|nr:SMP-30/gluconolactonase/LRE family protein [Novosphingobium sp.]MCP5402397.1 SMP-30/gluconolactonase/LRE family protein [Novosphingobium sp.]